MSKIKRKLRKDACIDTRECCLREDGICKALRETPNADGVCNFAKKTINDLPYNHIERKMKALMESQT